MQSHLLLSKRILTLHKWISLSFQWCARPGLVIMHAGRGVPTPLLRSDDLAILAANRIASLHLLAQITALLPFQCERGRRLPRMHRLASGRLPNLLGRHLVLLLVLCLGRVLDFLG